MVKIDGQGDIAEPGKIVGLAADRVVQPPPLMNQDDCRARSIFDWPGEVTDGFFSSRVAIRDFFRTNLIIFGNRDSGGTDHREEQCECHKSIHGLFP